MAVFALRSRLPWSAVSVTEVPELRWISARHETPLASGLPQWHSCGFADTSLGFVAPFSFVWVLLASQSVTALGPPLIPLLPVAHISPEEILAVLIPSSRLAQGRLAEDGLASYNPPAGMLS